LRYNSHNLKIAGADPTGIWKPNIYVEFPEHSEIHNDIDLSFPVERSRRSEISLPRTPRFCYVSAPRRAFRSVLPRQIAYRQL
jgi:hypothetical protein